MKLSMMAAMSRNEVIGNGTNIPWSAKGEQLLFKAITYNQWLIVGRKTFESDGLGQLPNRNYAVVSRSDYKNDSDNVLVFGSIEDAIAGLSKITDHAIVCGGGQIYRQTINLVDTIHLSTIEVEAEGAVEFPTIPENFNVVFEQEYHSNLNYTYRILRKEQ